MGRRKEWGIGKMFLLPSSIGLTSVTSVTSVIESVAELPTSIGLTSVTSVTESAAELPS